MQFKSVFIFILAFLAISLSIVSALSEAEEIELAKLYTPHHFAGKEWEDYFHASYLVATGFGSIKSGSYAVDVATKLSPTDWKCFREHASVAIPRGYRSIGAVDANLAENIRNLQSATGGFTVGSTHTYFFPCIKNCPDKSMETQFNELWSHMTKEKLKIQFLWLDIEEAKYWYSDKNLNQMKFEQLLGAAKAKNAAFGLYTSKNNWSEIFGLDYALKNLPVLFYPRYGVATDCSDFQPFAGFTKPLLHQFYGDRTTPCNIDHDMSVYC